MSTPQAALIAFGFVAGFIIGGCLVSYLWIRADKRRSNRAAVAKATTR